MGFSGATGRRGILSDGDRNVLRNMGVELAQDTRPRPLKNSL